MTSTTRRAGRIIDYTVPPVKCPECGLALDCATNCSGGGAPRPGDFSVCIRCLAVLRYTEGLQLRSTTLQDRQEAPEGTVDLIAAIQLAQLKSPDLGWGKKS